MYNLKVILNYRVNSSHPKLHKNLSKEGGESVVRFYLLNWKTWGEAWQPTETNPLGNP